jgi:predicted DNA binding CopG/RHH family protein
MPTPLRNVRVPDELWDAFKAKTASEGTDASAKVRELITQYLAD